jgi:hypothetical protein
MGCCSLIKHPTIASNKSRISGRNGDSGGAVEATAAASATKSAKV